MLQLNYVPVPKNGYRIEEIDGELLLFHPQTTATVYMNQTAALVWQLCDGHREVSEIVNILATSFPDAGQNIDNDVQTTLKMFLDQGALQEAA